MFLFIHILFVISAPNIKLRDENGKLDDWLMMSETHKITKDSLHNIVLGNVNYLHNSQ